jgi:hypothetical protein
LEGSDQTRVFFQGRVFISASVQHCLGVEVGSCRM